MLCAKTRAGLRQGNSEIIPPVSDRWFLLLYPIMGLPERGGAGGAMLIEVFVEPVAQHTASRLDASDLNAFASPPLLTSQ